jgi:hypothetical protein
MRDFFKVIKSFAMDCLFFRGTFWPEAILGIIGWIALFALVYSLFNILTFDPSS